MISINISASIYKILARSSWSLKIFVVWLFGGLCGCFLLRFSSPIEFIPKSTLVVLILASGIHPAHEHEQADSELQSIAMAVTAQHQGSILYSRLHLAILPLLLNNPFEMVHS